MAVRVICFFQPGCMGCMEQTPINSEVGKALNVRIEEIDAVVKTGGSSSIPLFTEMLVRLFGREKVKSSNAFSSVVAGLAIRAGRKAKIDTP